ncbi:MAG: hypothetical protein KAY65_11990 [Planctomycetes bacterium]|nr:hypothetical protein [Planctomycetota bacterium]
MSDICYKSLSMSLSNGVFKNMCAVDGKKSLFLLLVCICLMPQQLLYAKSPGNRSGEKRASDGVVLKKVLGVRDAGENLLRPDAWRPWQEGFERQGDIFVCDNGGDARVQRGASQAVTLNQVRPEPIVAVAWSKAEGVGGGRDSDYSLYLDLIYSDGTPLWGQVDTFNVGSHDWEKAKVIVFPAKPVRSVSFHILLRRHAGKAWFRGAELRVMKPPKGASLFDGVPVAPVRSAREGFAVRDVAAGSDFVRIERKALGLELKYRERRRNNAVFLDVSISDTTGKDRAITFVYTVPVAGDDCRWLADPRRSFEVEAGREYLNASSFGVGANGRLSRYPFAAVTSAGRGIGLGIDMARPGFFRVGYNAGTKELFLAYDIGLAPEKPTARLSFSKFDFDPKWRFRSALARYYEIFGDSFRRRIAEQGLWMPFAKISAVKGWEDFGFAFKEGTNETKWDDEHGIITFRYTEPMTWWMRMPKEMPRTLAAALGEARRLAEEKGDVRAKAFLSSGYHDQAGQFPARLRDTPWCDGAVWSINSMPGIRGEKTDFKNKWNPQLRERLYGPARAADLDGEYIDSSEGYVTDELDFRREHFGIAQTPLTFSLDSRKPAIFRGLIAFEYVRAIERDVHGMGKLMMANSTPIRLCWLAPLLDVMGTETNWNPGGKWRPMSDAELLYRRAMCKGKPYCFLMNTRFEEFSHELVAKYMKRALAYGMFPGFFSHNASQGHYFTRPELYERDRGLFKKYVPLCKLIAQAGWEPVTGAYSSDEHVYVERFGERYLTVFNDSGQERTVTITMEGGSPKSGRELVHRRAINWRGRKTTMTLGAEDVVLIQID